MRKSVSYNYSFGSTCETCGNEYERIKIKEVRINGYSKTKTSSNIPYCKQCRFIKHGLGEEVINVKGQTKSRLALSDHLRVIPIILGLVTYYLYSSFISDGDKYIGYGLSLAVIMITSIILKQTGILKKTIHVDDLGSYLLDDFDYDGDNEIILKKIEESFKGRLEYSHNNHFDRYDFFETYLKYKDKEERVFFVIESENISADNLLLLEYTKNRFANPSIHILYFDNYNNKLYLKNSEAEDIEGDLIEVIFSDE